MASKWYGRHKLPMWLAYSQSFVLVPNTNSIAVVNQQRQEWSAINYNQESKSQQMEK